MALGLFEGMGVLGPAVGFLLGGVFLSFWIDGGDAPADFTPDDELWIGNWWIGFVIGGCLALLTGILIALLPATLSTAKANQKTRRQEFHKGQTEMTTENTGKIRNDIKLSWTNFVHVLFLDHIGPFIILDHILTIFDHVGSNWTDFEPNWTINHRESFSYMNHFWTV